MSTKFSSRTRPSDRDPKQTESLELAILLQLTQDAPGQSIALEIAKVVS